MSTLAGQPAGFYRMLADAVELFNATGQQFGDRAGEGHVIADVYSYREVVANVADDAGVNDYLPVDVFHEPGSPQRLELTRDERRYVDLLASGLKDLAERYADVPGEPIVEADVFVRDGVYIGRLVDELGDNVFELTAAR